ncbi:carboxypeptidase-like regulatory domain-containing protein [Mucilaginibacter sp. S1162]|uniref:Carboxypeptidase-like regulatory domain-containing protein n=1 Tax=Mucilaginibacter humi TaxID=2732510 RepID=A0ABX1W0R1_9SPHI|nr:carboxypeptidase-like regulatory domain-containing protein [Mucilaginibacter humi]NNU33183.1 carboxypeptidase-like regulatory domain-containing protein [Mucilaginibacter humi]
MRSAVRLLFVALLSALATGVFAQAQYDVYGTVINEKGEPVKGATVFISGSEKIMPTTDDGHFRFARITPGTFKLSVQMLGYAPFVREIIIKNASLSAELRLQPKAINLNEVVIGSQRARANNYEIFKQQFLGWSRNGNQCVILNPKVLNFTTKKNLLLANADEFLVIENKRLGYRIRYLLQDFGYNSRNRTTLYHGEFSFEELTGTEEQKKEWAKNRAETYKGSLKHFLRSVYANNVLENGFVTKWVYGYGLFNKLESLQDSDKLKVISTPVKFDTLITAIDSNFISLKFKQLYITYNPKQAAAYLRAMADKDRKSVSFEKTVIFDHNASVLTLSTPQAIIDKNGRYTDYRTFL